MTQGSKQAAILDICRHYESERGRLLDILLDVQARNRCIDPPALETIASALGCTRVEVEGVASFYSFFSETPIGAVSIRLSDDIVDQHAGLASVRKVFQDMLGIGIGETSSDGRFSLHETPCIGMSDQAPAALINDRVFTRLDEARAREICSALLQGLTPAAIGSTPGNGNNAHSLINSEVRNNIRQAGEVLLGAVPMDEGLQRALTMTPEAVIDEVERSLLRGRGGAGFPTGRKWRTAAQTPATRRIVICNADEGEPGTFKDRVLLTERADLMVEGMTIAAHAIGSSEGIIYLRGEYSYLEAWLEFVLDRRREAGLLGKGIDGTDLDFDIRIQMGAGAYICGEDSSLIASCEGLRGEPKTKPPYPAESGYFGHPTIVNNVETLCCVPRILSEGQAWFRGFGTADSTGTKLFSVSGDVERPGVYELPFGETLAGLLTLTGGHGAAAVMVGGPSGQFVGRTAFDRTLGFEDLPTGGSVMVFSEQRDVLRIVEHYLGFFVDESCGYCTPCRVGNVFLKERIGRIRRGFAEPADIQYLQELSNTIIKTSRCGLGQTSPSPVLGSIEHFPLVYAALVKESEDGLQPGFDIQSAVAESRRLAKRRSYIFDPSYDGD